MQEKKCKKTKTKTGTKDQPEEVPKEAKSWSNRSKTDNSKSEAMGLGLGKDNGLQLPVLSTVLEQIVVVEEEEVAVRSSASISVCKQGPLLAGISHDCCCCCWLLFRLPVSCKWEGRFLTRLTVTILLDALVFEFSSSDKSVRCSGLVEAASIFQLDKIKRNQKMKQKTKKKKTHKIKHQHQPNIKEKNDFFCVLMHELKDDN